MSSAISSSSQDARSGPLELALEISVDVAQMPDVARGVDELFIAQRPAAPVGEARALARGRAR